MKDKEIAQIAKKVAEMLAKGMKRGPEKPTPRCEFKWEDDALVLECESPADRDRAKDILEKGDVRIRVKPRDEEQRDRR